MSCSWRHPLTLEDKSTEESSLECNIGVLFTRPLNKASGPQVEVGILKPPERKESIFNFRKIMQEQHDQKKNEGERAQIRATSDLKPDCVRHRRPRRQGGTCQRLHLAPPCRDEQCVCKSPGCSARSDAATAPEENPASAFAGGTGC